MNPEISYQGYLDAVKWEASWNRERYTTVRRPLERWRKRSDGGWEMEPPWGWPEEERRDHWERQQSIRRTLIEDGIDPDYLWMLEDAY